MKKIITLLLILVAALSLNKSTPRFFFPHRAEKKVMVFSYGSLLNESSALKTLTPDAWATRRLAIGYGIKRLFNRNIPEELITPRFGPLKHPLERAALNVLRTSNMKDTVNGVLIEVSSDELESLLKREIGYELVPIIVSLWDEQDNPNYFRAFTFSAPNQYPVTVTDIYPVSGYYELVFEGAAAHGEAFFKEYLQRTYLADGKTTLAAWEAMGREKNLLTSNYVTLQELYIRR